ncbi:hypothetical protein AB5N19_06910 [Seiridium cardinale]
MASRQLRPTTAQHANGKGYLLQSGRDKTARWQTHVDTFASGKYEEVDDNRVQHIHLSLGTRMQRRVGLQPDGTFTNPAYPILERLYYKYQWSEEFTKDYVASFTAETGLLVRDTISDATALCSTVSRAADSLVTGAYGALTDLILVDEASKIAEYEGWPWIAFYRGAIGKLMIGDIDQLQPFVGKHEKDNSFKAQIELSLQERMQDSISLSMMVTARTSLDRNQKQQS